MIILYVIILLLCIIVVILSLAINYILKKTYYFSEKEKDFITFTIDIYSQYAMDLGIQTKEQHDKLVIELNKIKNKFMVNKT